MKSGTVVVLVIYKRSSKELSLFKEILHKFAYRLDGELESIHGRSSVIIMRDFRRLLFRDKRSVNSYSSTNFVATTVSVLLSISMADSSLQKLDSSINKNKSEL